jgi:dipeptidyl aminopeptidase/acylaminoacyl peptidase
VAAYRFPYRDHQPPKMSLASALEDAEAAVELLAAHPQVDAKKLAVVGFSFGGAVAALLAGGERRIRAAVLGAGTSKRDGYLDPVGVLAKSKARVLLIWGSQDTEVATIHADRYTTALTKAGVVHEFVTLEGADHDFGPAASRAQLAARVVSWVRESFTD